MHFKAIAASIAALGALVLAQTPGFDAISRPGYYETVPAGEAYSVQWAPNDVAGTVTLQLLGGPSPARLFVLGTDAVGVDNRLGNVTWKVDSALGDDDTYVCAIRGGFHGGIYSGIYGGIYGGIYASVFVSIYASVFVSSYASTFVGVCASIFVSIYYKTKTNFHVHVRANDLADINRNTIKDTVTNPIINFINKPVKNTVANSIINLIDKLIENSIANPIINLIDHAKVITNRKFMSGAAIIDDL